MKKGTPLKKEGKHLGNEDPERSDVPFGEGSTYP